MKRHIHCQVAGAYARSDSHFAGVRGSANAMQIIVELGEPWQLCTSITATFTDANGENPNVIPLIGGETKYANKINDTTYLFAVPQSAAAVAGKIQLVFDGYIPQGTTQTVDESADVVSMDDTTGVTAVAVEGPARLRAVEVYTIADAHETITDEWGSVQPTEVEKLIAELQEVTDNAMEILQLNAHPPKIENGYWYLWDIETDSYKQAGKAQGEKGDKGDGGSAATGSVGFAELDEATKQAAGMYYQVNYLSMGATAKQDETKTLKFYHTGLKGEVITSDTPKNYFEAGKYASSAADMEYEVRALKDVVVRISANVKLYLGTKDTAATGGQRALHVMRGKSGETGSEEVVSATIQDWSKTKGKPYSISAAPRVVKLSEGDRLWMNVYLKKNDSIDAENTWLLIEAVRPTNWANS